jgi:lysophospholipase L1-like esterase
MFTFFTRIRVAASLAMAALFFGQCQSQLRPPLVEITNQDTVGYTIVSDKVNQIINTEHLDPFFEKLYLQRTQGGRKVSVLHIGDSHILGNFLTKEVRTRMQRAFGDAGRGFIFPYKIAGSNGPKDYLVQSNANWSGANCVRELSEVSDFGVSGFTLQTFNNKGGMNIRLSDTATAETRSFTKVTVFYRNRESAYDFKIRDEVSHQVASPVIEDDFSQTWYFDRPVGEFTLEIDKKGAQKELKIDGFSLENELAGVLYHSIGVNGAKFSDYTRSKYFARQTRELMPDLIVLSFGTNEAQAKLNPTLLRRQMEELTQQLLSQWPHAQILLTTPADSYLRGKGFNPNMPDVAATIKGFAADKGYAVWDLFNMSGGENSAEAWKTRGLMSQDSVHYSKTGYAVQGKLLYQAIIKAYNEAALKKIPKK